MKKIIRISPPHPTKLTWEEEHPSNYRFDTSVLERLREAVARWRERKEKNQ